MNSPFTAYSTAQEIFTNNKYLDILKSKDYILELKPEEHKVTYTIIDKIEENKKIDKTPYDKLINIINDTKIVNLAHTKKLFWKYKYLEKKICDKVCYSCSYTCLSINYLLKKYMNCQLINKTILTIAHINTNLTYYTSEAYNTLFNPNVLYLFNTCKNCVFYCILNIDNNDKYKQTVIHKENNNVYHLLTYNTNGNILDKKTFDIVNERLKNINFDVVFIYELQDLYINNIILTYLYIIIEHSSKTTQIIIKSQHSYINIFAGIMSSNAHMIIYNIHINYIDTIPFIYIYNIINHTPNNIIYQILSTDKYVDIQYSKPEYITKYFNKIFSKSAYKYNILHSIIDITDKNEYNILLQTIHTKQKYYAQKQKYLKYLMPY